ncbi:MAG: hypothetical protein FD175_2986 [Beijerinckiaceae bacterium]|nr:MAG: hypothetical protein FD175_2986 [Beijerinckiaceae bacterium]
MIRSRLLVPVFWVLVLAGAASAASPRGLGFDNFTATGPLDHVGRGFSSMLETDAVPLLDSPEYKDCKLAVREVKKMGEVLKELELQKSPGFDQSKRISPNFIDLTYRVTGEITSTANSLDWTIKVTDTRTGEVVASKSGKTNWDSDDTLKQMQDVLKELVDKVCPKAYRLQAGAGEFKLNGIVCDIEKPWDMRPAGGFSGVAVRFTPKSRDGGDFRQSGKAYGWQWNGGGPYSIRWNGDSGQFEARDQHTISAPIPAGKQKRDETLRGTLTRAPRCG